MSLRAHAGVNIEPVARKLGGGGHHQAAGCEVAGGMDEVEKTVVAELTQLLRDGGTNNRNVSPRRAQES